MDSRKARAVIRIVDDDAGVRESYKFLIESEGWLVRTYPSAEAFLELDDPSIPGCGIFDVRMTGLTGMELHEKLLELSHRLPVIFVSAHGDIEMAVKAIRRGAIDFLTKPIVDEKLLSSIEMAVSQSFEEFEASIAQDATLEAWKVLSPRERQVAMLVSEGLMNKVIADRLGIADRTVQVHRSNVCQKLGVKHAVGVSQIITQLRRLGAIE